jgi:hypothetical protein
MRQLTQSLPCQVSVPTSLSCPHCGQEWEALARFDLPGWWFLDYPHDDGRCPVCSAAGVLRRHTR